MFFGSAFKQGFLTSKHYTFWGEFTFEFSNGSSLKFNLNFNDTKVFDEHLIRKAKNL